MEPWMRRLEEMRATVVRQNRREAFLRDMEELLERHFEKLWKKPENREMDEEEGRKEEDNPVDAEADIEEDEVKNTDPVKTATTVKIQKQKTTSHQISQQMKLSKKAQERHKTGETTLHVGVVREQGVSAIDVCVETATTEGTKMNRPKEPTTAFERQIAHRSDNPLPPPEPPDSGALATALPEPKPPDTGRPAAVLSQPEPSFAVTLATTTGSLLVEPKGTDSTEPHADDNVGPPPPSEQPEQPVKGVSMGLEEEKSRSIERIRSLVASASPPEPPDPGPPAAIPQPPEPLATGQLATASGSSLTSSRGMRIITEAHVIHFEKKDRGAKQVIGNLGVILNLMGQAQSYNSPNGTQKGRMGTTNTSNGPLNNDISFFNCDSSAIGYVFHARKVDFIIIDGLQNIEILILPVGHSIGSCISIEMFKTGRCSFQKIFEQQLLQLPGITPCRVVLENAKEKLERSCKGIERLLGDVTCDYDTLDYHEIVDQHLEPLFLCYESLQSCGFGVLVDGPLADLIHRVAIFGMMLIKLDIQQEFGRYAETLDAIIKYLDMGTYSEREEEIFARASGTSYFKEWDPGGLSLLVALREGRPETRHAVSTKETTILCFWGKNLTQNRAFDPGGSKLGNLLGQIVEHEVLKYVLPWWRQVVLRFILCFLAKSNTQNRVFDPGGSSSVSDIPWSLYLSHGNPVEVILSAMHFFHLEDKVNFKRGVLLGLPLMIDHY